MFICLLLSRFLLLVSLFLSITKDLKKSVNNLKINLIICDRLSAQQGAVLDVCQERNLRVLFDGPHLLKSVRRGIIRSSAQFLFPTPVGPMSSAPLFALYKMSLQPFAVCFQFFKLIS